MHRILWNRGGAAVGAVRRQCSLEKCSEEQNIFNHMEMPQILCVMHVSR